jgi:zinc transporter ZupT
MTLPGLTSLAIRFSSRCPSKSAVFEWRLPNQEALNRRTAIEKNFKTDTAVSKFALVASLLDSMEVEAFKYVGAAIIIVLAVIGTIIAVKVRTDLWLERLKAVTAGVFIATALTHLLPIATEDLDEQSESGYPIGGAVTAATFVVLTGISIFTYTERDALRDQAKELKRQEERNLQDTPETASNEEEKPDRFSPECRCMPLAVVSVYVVLCIHAFLEGLMLGFAEEWPAVIALLLAVGSNKFFETFALGQIVIQTKPTIWVYWIMLLVAAVLSSLATIIALNISTSVTATFHGVVGALGAGTFLFIGCEAWLTMFRNKNRTSTKDRLWFFGLFILGALVILLIALKNDGHAHDHGETDHDHDEGEHEDEHEHDD